MASQTAWNKGFVGSLAALGVFVVIVLVAFGLQSVSAPHSDAAPTPSVSATPTVQPSVSPTPSPTPSSTTNCDPRFVQEPDSHGDDGKVDAGFTDAYNKATAGKTGDDLAKAQRDVLLQRAGVNAKRLAAWSYANHLWPDPNKWKELVTADGKCLSQDGVMLWSELNGALSGNGTKFDEGNAPSNGHNSGDVNNTFVVSPEPGVIDSQRKAIIITYRDGSKVYILVYCGNVVFPAPPAGVPTSPEVPHPAPETPSAPIAPPTPVVPPTPVCTGSKPYGMYPLCWGTKNPTLDPAPQGNAPVGGGLNANPGPGPYIPAPQMQQPPSTPYAAPPAPAPQPAQVTGSNGTVIPAPAPNPEGPRPTATPEPAAPAPTAAPTSCAIAPGKTSC